MEKVTELKSIKEKYEAIGFQKGVESKLKEQEDYEKYINLFDTDILVKKLESILSLILYLNTEATKDDIWVKARVIGKLDEIVGYMLSVTKNESEGK